MTPEEIRNTIEQMLAVQRQIQESQLRNTDNIARLEMQVEANGKLIESNAKQIEANAKQIEANGELIEENKNLLRESIRSNRENINILVAEISKLTVDQKEKFNQFYGYHQSADSDRLDIMERLIKVEREVAQIKQKLGDR